MPTNSHILVLDFLAGPPGVDPADGIGLDGGGITGSEGFGAAGSDGGNVCVGGCGLACGSIN